MTSNDEYALEILLEKGLVAHEQVEQARELVAGATASALDLLLDEKIVAEEDVLQILAAQLGMQVVSLKELEVPPELRDLIPVEIARRYKVVPFSKNGDLLTVAFADL